MTGGHSRGIALCAALATATATSAADAFFLLGKGEDVHHDRTTVVVLREGERTVVTLQPHFRGPAQPLILLVPVPALGSSQPARAASVRSLDRLRALTSPRLAELWEQDPCEAHLALPGPPEDASDADARPDDATVRDSGSPGGRYDVVDSSWESAEVAVEWLEAEGYRVPPRAAAFVGEVLAAGRRFVAAKIDGSQLVVEQGGASLPPLRVSFDAPTLTLPTRLAAFGGGGAHEMVVFALAPGVRYEAAHGPNLAVPTNLDVVPIDRASVGALYDALVGYTLGQRPGAVLTEYAWRASTCAPCPTAALSVDEWPLFGTDALTSAALGRQHEVLIDAAAVSSSPGGPDRLRARLDDCYAKALAAEPGVAGDATLDVITGEEGEVRSATLRGAAPPALGRCATDTLLGERLGTPRSEGALTVTFSPRSRRFHSELVLTKLRVRLTQIPERDLELRPGRPIEGGREIGPSGHAEQRVAAAEPGAGDNFQPRYVIRHKWAGKVDCLSPERGVWGPRPASAKEASDGGVSAQEEPSSGAVETWGGGDDGAGVLGILRLEALLVGGLPDLAPFELTLGPGVAKPGPSPRPAPPPPPPPLPPPAAESSAKSSGGCGSCAIGVRPWHDGRGPLGAMVASWVGWAARRRRLRNRARA